MHEKNIISRPDLFKYRNIQLPCQKRKVKQNKTKQTNKNQTTTTTTKTNNFSVISSKLRFAYSKSTKTYNFTDCFTRQVISKIGNTRHGLADYDAI